MKIFQRNVNSIQLLVLLACIALLLRVLYQPEAFQNISSEQVFNYEVRVSFDPGLDDVNIRTYLPLANTRQKILAEKMNSGQLNYSERESTEGRHATWSGSKEKTIVYQALLYAKEFSYQINPQITINQNHPEELQIFLQKTEAIPVGHPEITALWQSIKPSNQQQVKPIVTAIYEYIYTEIEGAEFKGYTDALTALRLKQASCNGKGRLFVALARQNGIPARLIGGVILNNGSKKTSHQWAELYIGNHWVPFDPTNGHFAGIPANYLQLYVGDKALFSHTKDIRFDYRFNIDNDFISPLMLQLPDVTVPQVVIQDAVVALTHAGFSANTAKIFLLFPFATLVIAFLRNVIGLTTLGIFVPVLIAAASIYTGLWLGLMMFSGVLIFAVLSHAYLGRLKLLKIPRLSAIITICTAMILIISFLLGEQPPLKLGVLSLFPIIIISFLAEKIHTMVEDSDWSKMILSLVGTLISTVLCFLTFESVFLQRLISTLPELLLIILALLIYVGQWPGVRLSEYFRFKGIIGQGSLLGMNQRNLGYIYKKNSKHLLMFAVDKLKTKEQLAKHQIPVPATLYICRSLSDIQASIDQIRQFPSFALKPNKGSKGNGIIIITEVTTDNFISAGGSCYNDQAIRRHITEIISGNFSQEGEADIAYIEPLIQQHHALQSLSPYGLADIRVILHEGKPVSAMLRLPTKRSNGKANLHQGAVGISIDIETGTTNNAVLKNLRLETHPDSSAKLIGITLPFWHEIIAISEQCYQAVSMGYMGVDICIDNELGPLVLEINGRPGLEIQNVQQKGLRHELAS